VIVPENDLDGRYRVNIKLWIEVDIVSKRDQRTGKLTRGIVQWVLTSKPYHSRGIKVMLSDRTVGRVQHIHSAVPKPPQPFLV